MNPSARKNSLFHLVRNPRGQISIFIALIFNILFVFFAMVINVGMLVHDKINLQNSVDLAAYYAAAKQAEQLNAIAHTNYQIRQSWKLLAWRIRAIGDIGRPGHPLFPSTPAYATDSLYDPSGTGNPSQRDPIVCIAHGMWADGSGTVNGQSSGQNLCTQVTFAIPPIPDSPVIFPVLPINAEIAAFAQQQQQVTLNSCQDVGALDWSVAANWYLGYRFDVATKKKAIRTIASKLSASPDDFVDITGASARDGAIATLRNNLTRANLDGLSNSGISLFNSLSTGGDWTQWLHEINIYPIIYYADITGTGNSQCGGTTGTLNFGGALPVAFSGPNGAQLKLSLDPGNAVSSALGEPDTNPKDDVSLSHSTAGYEKNPWMVAYVGFKATTNVIKPFAPFGGSVQLVARSFAKPFGGRIGPWMYQSWPSGQLLSQSSGMTDPLLPAGLTTVSGTPRSQNFAVPNYSRFPNDAFGLSSGYALGAMKAKVAPYAINKSLTRGYWSKLPAAVLPATGGDVLAVWDDAVINDENGTHPLAPVIVSGSNRIPWVRPFELEAIAPDLFDITYYSIEPKFFTSYAQRAKSAGLVLTPDIGYSTTSITGYPANFDISMELPSKKISSTTATDFVGMTYGSNVPFYIVKDLSHILTGWVNSGAYDYTVSSTPPLQFASCNHYPNQPVPGCVEGGRSGYSVKLVSKSYLMSSTVTSGPNTQPGPIVNPPGDF